MCRFFAYSGAPIRLYDVLIAPEASLVTQSSSARQAKTVVNGDGCGLGWYGEYETPGVFRDTRPAWSDANFASLCEQIRSRQFMAHVRSATSGDVSRANSHPFSVGRYLFMHNGQIGGYKLLRRKLENLIPDHLYPSRSGTSDSEMLFLIALGLGASKDPIGAVAKTLCLCRGAMLAEGITEPLRFSAALSDGESIHAFRWSSDRMPPSLYTRELAPGVAISSEPFTLDAGPWREVPPYSVVRVQRNNIEVLPFHPETK